MRFISIDRIVRPIAPSQCHWRTTAAREGWQSRDALTTSSDFLSSMAIAQIKDLRDRSRIEANSLGFMKTIRNRILGFFIVLIIVGLVVGKPLIHLLTEVWWFNSVGFTPVFWTRLTWQVWLWVLTFGAYFLFLWGNYQWARRWSQAHLVPHTPRLLESSRDFQLNGNLLAIVNPLAAIFCGLIAWLAAALSATHWEVVLKFFNATAFGDRDPIFQQDISFYVFRLPFYDAIHDWLFGLVVLGLLGAGAVYGLINPQLSQRDGLAQIVGGAKVHLSLLLGAIALLMGWGFWLERYHLLTQPSQVVFGAGYADVHARLLALSILSLLAVGVAVLWLFSITRKSFTLPLRGIGIFGVTFLLFNILYPLFLQQFVVSPNELEKEKPYLAHNIQLTQKAYHLQAVQRQEYAAETKLDRQTLQANQSTIRNIRLWDYRPLLSTYKQLQEIRLYYKFRDVDVDRYTLNNDYQQVMLSARELAYEQLPAEAKTWVNQRLKYTHGYGLVMSPVNKITSDGLPELYVKNIPPVATVNLSLNSPAIYYGEETKDYIFTGTTTEEFDYPQGDTNALTHYAGQGGVPMPTIVHRLAYALDRNSLELLISNYFTQQSRIHYYRDIQTRVSHIAPFLQFDQDPYLAIVNGKLIWIIDAYTVSDRYPYSEPFSRLKNSMAIAKDSNLAKLTQSDINYIRNSVKVTVDAYDGTVQFFIVDESDPVLATYQRIFPDLFAAKSTIPAEVKAHFRYPQDLFTIQTQMYLTYHMSDPEVFYNREDLWRSPLQTYEGSEVTMQPYYVIMRLPGAAKEEFLLILPFTPSNKDNMVAWLAARSNGSEAGKLLLYEFPKQKLVYGPRQIEARIDQTPQISQQLTLWNQSGSKVIRGDLLVIPIEQSLLYVEPLYLRAEQGQLPELKRVIVAYDKSIVMAETLEQALAETFGGQSSPQAVPKATTPVAPSLVKSALDTYRKAQEALRQGNWADYGRLQQALEKILQQLNQPAQSSV